MRTKITKGFSSRLAQAEAEMIRGEVTPLEIVLGRLGNMLKESRKALIEGYVEGLLRDNELI